VSDLYSPVDGEVTDVNSDVEEDPGQVNTDPYGAGWLFKVRLDEDPPSDLLSAEQYAELIKDDG
jgi:glycine cleavage system H protein